jgi:hypothetical protein
LISALPKEPVPPVIKTEELSNWDIKFLHVALYLQITEWSILLIPMRFVFRADASREIGSGHVMRSSVLAEEAISRGFECVFIGKISDLDWVAKRISTLGFTQVLSEET